MFARLYSAGLLSVCVISAGCAAAGPSATSPPRPSPTSVVRATPTPTTAAASTPSVAPSSSPSHDAEDVFRAFNAAITAGDEERAADLLADGSQILHQMVTEGTVDQIVAGFNCTAEIVSADEGGETIEVRLRFTGTRPGASSECEPIGAEETLLVTVRDGKIVSIDEPTAEPTQ